MNKSDRLAIIALAVDKVQNNTNNGLSNNELLKIINSEYVSTKAKHINDFKQLQFN